MVEIFSRTRHNIDNNDARSWWEEQFMTEQPNIPGPGEDEDPANREMEGFNGPVPVGEMPGEAPDRRRTLEMRAVDLAGDAPDVDHNSIQRRTGTEREGYALVHTGHGPTETRLDDSARDLQRESVFDTVPDDAGPQSDKC